MDNKVESNPVRMRGRYFDVVDYTVNKSLSRASSIINPLFVLKAQLSVIDKPIAQIDKVIFNFQEKLLIVKSQKSQCKTTALDYIDFFLINPQFLAQCPETNKLTLQKCIINKIRLGESVYSNQIKGGFLDQEKSFLIDSSKIQMLWKGVHDYLKKKRENTKLNQLKNISIQKSQLIYPPLNESLRVFFHTFLTLFDLSLGSQDQNVRQYYRQQISNR